MPHLSEVRATGVEGNKLDPVKLAIFTKRVDAEAARLFHTIKTEKLGFIGNVKLTGSDIAKYISDIDVMVDKAGRELDLSEAELEEYHRMLVMKLHERMNPLN